LLSQLPERERQEALSSLTEEEAKSLEWDWDFWARPNQRAPDWRWFVWLMLAGRGYGKTRSGCEWLRARQEAGFSRFAIIGRTSADVRDILVEGESGIMSISPPWNRPKYEPAKRRVTWPNGAYATTYSAEEPDVFRGPQFDSVLCDELAAWRNLDSAWSNIMFGLRLGTDPRCVAMTTPRPVGLIKKLLKRESTAITRGSSFENRANLSATFYSEAIEPYIGTRIGQQEIEGQVLEDVPGALWTQEMLDKLRVDPGMVPNLVRVVIGVDPAVSAESGSNETGIIVVGKSESGHAYVFDDVSGVCSPTEWGQRVVDAYDQYQVERIIGEANNGGDLVEANIRAAEGGSNVSYKKVHAARGKKARAEPISHFYERGFVHHVGSFPLLEAQMTAVTTDGYQGTGSPDRMDGLVWALTELMLDGPVSSPADPRVAAMFRASSMYA
jgi:phage terminase large subunit-like protein